MPFCCERCGVRVVDLLFLLTSLKGDEAKVASSQAFDGPVGRLDRVCMLFLQRHLGRSCILLGKASAFCQSSTQNRTNWRLTTNQRGGKLRTVEGSLSL